MSKFQQMASPATSQRHPIATTEERRRNAVGHSALSYTPEAELFLLAATNMVSERTFHEGAAARDRRFVDLIHAVTEANPEFISGSSSAHERVNGAVGLAQYLRQTLGMRSASVVMACEYVRAGGANGRRVVASVCQRPDEPGEVLAYWHSHFGRNEPKPIKRGVADAVTRLYNEKAVLRWDSSRSAIRFADVLERVHPTPKNDAQRHLFRYLLDEHHHNNGAVEALPILREDRDLISAPADLRRDWVIARAVPPFWSWERLAGWLPGGMDAVAWEAVIPNMGVMALIRNLRNFDAAGISERAVDEVIAQITDPEQVAKSRIFPYQVWSAYREARSDNWKRALGKTLDLACSNVPQLDGGTLVVVDCSGSMDHPVSEKSTLSRMELAASMGAALAKANKADIVCFAVKNILFPWEPGAAALTVTAKLSGLMDDGYGRSPLGGGTYLHTAILNNWNPAKYRRVVVFTDDQAHDSELSLSSIGTLYRFDLAGYGHAASQSGRAGHYTFGGYSDASLAAIPALEGQGHAGWPFV